MHARRLRRSIVAVACGVIIAGTEIVAPAWVAHQASSPLAQTLLAIGAPRAHTAYADENGQSGSRKARVSRRGCGCPGRP